MPDKCSRDPRDVLVQDKYYTHLPDPLLDWLIRARIPDSAKRVFLAHWRAGQINGDWCSEIPLKALAAQCQLDVSTVTRAYQLLARHGLIRRQDPGRDPARPFQQAVALTEVRLPRELVQKLDQYPNRRTQEVRSGGSASPRESSAAPAAPGVPVPEIASADPFSGLSLRERTKTLNRLIERMSAAERVRYHDAVRLFQATITFDPESRLSAEEQRTVLQLLSRMAKASLANAAAPRPGVPTGRSEPQPRRLSALEIARLRRDLQAARGTSDVDELLREVLWSVEEGALSRFAPLHATRIALKKIREGAWSRPNRMPPQWARSLYRPRPHGQSPDCSGRGRTTNDRVPVGASSTSVRAAPKIAAPAPRPAASGPHAISSLLSSRHPAAPPRTWAGPELCRGA